MKLFICGQKSFGAAAFTALIGDGHEVLGVCSPRDGDKLFDAAADAGLLPVSPNALRSSDIPPGTDLIVCAHNHAYISYEVRKAARLGAISYHPSLLPRHRGRDAIEWAIRMHDPVTGGTVYWLDDGADTGPIAKQEWCWIEPGQTASELWRKTLFPLGTAMLRDVVSDLDLGIDVPRERQNEKVATFEPALGTGRLAAAAR
jgi:methionyl-tRNA formyltransferase